MSKSQLQKLSDESRMLTIRIENLRAGYKAMLEGLQVHKEKLNAAEKRLEGILADIRGIVTKP